MRMYMDGGKGDLWCVARTAPLIIARFQFSTTGASFGQMKYSGIGKLEGEIGMDDRLDDIFLGFRRFC